MLLEDGGPRRADPMSMVRLAAGRLRHGGWLRLGEPRPGPSKRAIGAEAERAGNGAGQLFSAGARAPLHREAK
jgi:hypothetical protein